MNSLKTKDAAYANMLQTAFDAIPSFVFVVDDDVKIQVFNQAAAGLMTEEKSKVLKHRAGDVMTCLHSTEASQGCGTSFYCKDCIIRNSVSKAIQGKVISRSRTKLEIIRADNIEEIHALITASPFNYESRQFVLLVIEDISELAELQRIIPICAKCRRIRDDKESWQRLETYFKDQLDVDFSHGLCPDCMAELYPEIHKKMNSETPLKS